MKFSIITAVYNREDTIERSILSVKNQSHKNVQYIIIDGNSNDETCRIIKNLISSEDIFISENDEGIYDALNKGINIASGDVVCFLHSDDVFFYNNTLRDVSLIFETSGADIIYGNVIFFLKKRPDKIFRQYVSKELSIRNLSMGLMPAHTAMFIKKSVYDSIGGFNLKYLIAGDFDWLFKATKNGKFKSYYSNNYFVKMQYGGASTNGLKSMLLLNNEVKLILASYGIKFNWISIIKKYFNKFSEFKF